MKDIEKILREEKIEHIEVPEELESRLYKALENSTPAAGAGRRNWKVIVAAACAVLLLSGYNYNALAYYGKKLLGYDQVMNGTLKQLNELGEGQPIGESYTFKNGLTVILDGIMADENQLLAFYTLKDPAGGMDKVPIPFMYIDGFFKQYRQRSGHGEINADLTEMKWIQSFDKPSVFEKKLQMKLTQPGNNDDIGVISFKIDQSKAMGYTLKQNINKTIHSGDTKINLESIVASPTKTVVYGSIQNIVELAMDQMLGERLRPYNIEMRLIANGKEVEHQGGGMSTDMKGMRFHREYDALPDDLKSVQLNIVSFTVDRDVNKKADIRKGNDNQIIEVLGQDIVINKVYETEGNTCITFTTSEDIVLTRVGLMIDGNRVSLKETINSELTKLEDGKILHTRTMRFPGTGSEYQLSIEKMKYTEPYNKTIDIPTN